MRIVAYDAVVVTGSVVLKTFIRHPVPSVNITVLPSGLSFSGVSPI